MIIQAHIVLIKKLCKKTHIELPKSTGHIIDQLIDKNVHARKLLVGISEGT